MLTTLRLIAGFLLVGLGVMGLALPLLPGWIFLIPGLALLSRHFHWAHRLWHFARRVRASRAVCPARDPTDGGRPGVSAG